MTNYIKLVKLVDYSEVGESQEQTQRWLENLKVTGVEHGYMLGDETTSTEISEDELEQVEDIAVFDFIGSWYEDERFYQRDIEVFKHKVSGEYFVVETEDLWEF